MDRRTRANSLSFKLTLRFLIIAGFAAVVGIFGIMGLLLQSNSSDSVMDLTEMRDIAGRLNICMSEQSAHYQSLVQIMDDPGALSSRYERIRSTSADSEALLSQMSGYQIDNTADGYYNTLSQTYRSQWLPLCQNMESAVSARDDALARRYAKEIMDLADTMLMTVNSLFEYTNVILSGTVDTNAVISSILIYAAVVLVIVAVFFSIVLGRVQASRISTPIRRMATAAERLAVGDFQVDLNIRSNDELGLLADSFQRMVDGMKEQVGVLERLAQSDYSITVRSRSDRDVTNAAIDTYVGHSNRVLHEIRASSEQVAQTSMEIANGAQSLAAGASEQSSTIHDLRSAMSTLEQRTDENAKNAQKATGVHSQAQKVLDDSIHSMEQVLAAMAGIDESSQNISKIIKVIEDIAFQTNILALNAAVEAARAGQQGKGFAVVADEVRTLANKCAAAANESAVLIQGSTMRVREGNELVARTNANFQEVVQNTLESADLLGSVSAASLEQAVQLQEIGRQIQQISTVVQNSSSTAEQLAAAAEEMSSQASQLDNMVRQFKLRRTADIPDNRRETTPQKSYGTAYSDSKYGSIPAPDPALQGMSL